MTELERILEDFGNHVYAKALGHKVWGIETVHTQIKNYCQEQVRLARIDEILHLLENTKIFPGGAYGVSTVALSFRLTDLRGATELSPKHHE